MQDVRRILIASALALGLSVIPITRAHAQLAAGVGGGATWPLGTMSDTYTTGYNILAYLSLGEKVDPLNIRFDGMFNDLGHKSSIPINNQQMWTLNANIVYNIGAAKGKSVTPYIMGGAGYYNTSYNVTATGETLVSTGNIHANSLGLNGGIGLHLGQGSLAGFVELRYHYVFVGNHNFQFLPLTAGITL